MLDRVTGAIDEYISSLHMPTISPIDVIEIVILSFLIYYLLAWIRNTRAWALFKGMIVILVFLLIAVMFEMTTILWLVEHALSTMVIALVVVLQPELRRALEQLGQKNIVFSFLNPDTSGAGRYSDHTIDEVVRASFAMGRAKTGALMVFERNENLSEYEKTGIAVDAQVTSQLLINIFEHNTPLHDGAVIFRNDRIVAATCYLPLSDNRSLSKALGTRHRAAVGISENTDSLTVIVSEENGKVSVALGGELYSGLTQEGLREKLELIQDKPVEETRKRFRTKIKGGDRHEKAADT